MAQVSLVPSQPIVVAGKTYDKLAMTLAISPVYQGANVTASVAMVLTPYRYDQFGNTDKLEGHDRTVVIKDIDLAVQSDMGLAQAMLGLLTGVQTYINAKGL